MSTQKRVEVKKNFSERIKLLVGEDSVNGFAKKIGIKQAALDRYIKAINSPAADALVAISKECGVSVDWLLGLSDTRTPGGATVTASSGSGHASAVGTGTLTVNAPPSEDSARMEELLETQRLLIATQQRLIETLSKAPN